MQPPSSLSQVTPPLISHTHYCVVGDVTVDAAAAIAPGVVLQAQPGSRILIDEGACLGAGVCVHARGGILRIGTGASLGANVLLIGCGVIGANACISPGSTVVNPRVDIGTLLPPNSLIDYSATAAHGASTGHWNNGLQSKQGPNQGQSAPSGQGTVGEAVVFSATAVSTTAVSATTVGMPAESITAASPPASYDRVYGREQLTDLIAALFPHRQSLNGQSSSSPP